MQKDFDAGDIELLHLRKVEDHLGAVGVEQRLHVGKEIFCA
jgi:hypothetical protein